MIRHPLSLTIALLVTGGCAERPEPPRSPLSARFVDDSVICQRLADRFVGLPALTEGPALAGAAPTPLVGRWWLRDCTATRDNNEFRVRLRGPGWYFIDRNDGDLALRQQVPFDLSIELGGSVQIAATDGIFSLWLTPDREPDIKLQVSEELNVRATSAWGQVLRALPLVSVRARAAEYFAETASSALRLKLREGATLTYDLGAGQADATLGRLAAGQTPPAAFQDGVPWLVNDRLSLAPEAVHVVGPIEPGPTRLDVTVERGTGARYRTLCAEDMPADYASLSRGDASSLVAAPDLPAGYISGVGPHTTDFELRGCRFYLVVSALDQKPALISLRVRA